MATGQTGNPLPNPANINQATAATNFYAQSLNNAAMASLRARRDFASFADATGRGAITMENFGKVATNATKKVAVWQLAIASVYGVMRYSSAVIDSWKQLELTLSRIGITTSAVGKGLQAYFRQVADVAIEFGMPIEQTLEGMDLALRATASLGAETRRTTVAVQLLKDASILANITGMQYSKSIDILVSSLRQTGLELDEGQKLMDKWVAVQKAAQVSVSDLASSFAIMSDAGESAGLTIDQINGLVAAFSETASVSPTEVGNAIRALMSTLYNDASINQLQKYGVAVTDVNGETRNFWEIMMQLSAMKESNALDDTQWLDIARAAGAGQRRYAQFLMLLSQMPKANEMAAVSSRAQGDSLDANARIVNTLTNAYDQYTAAQRKMWMAMGDGTGAIRDLTSTLQTLADVMSRLSEMSDKIWTLGRGLVFLAGTLGALKVASLSMGWFDVAPRMATMIGPFAGIKAEQIAGTAAVKKAMVAESKRLGRNLKEQEFLDLQNSPRRLGYYSPTYANSMGTHALAGLIPGLHGYVTRKAFQDPMKAGGFFTGAFSEVYKKDKVTGQMMLDAEGNPILDKYRANRNLGNIVRRGRVVPIEMVDALRMGNMDEVARLRDLQNQEIYNRWVQKHPNRTRIPARIRNLQTPWQLDYDALIRDKVVPKATWGSVASRFGRFAINPMGMTGSAIAGVGMGAAAFGITNSKAAMLGSTIAGGIGAAFGGPIGMLAGGALGGFIGKTMAEAFISNEERIKKMFTEISEKMNIDLVASYDRFVKAQVDAQNTLAKQGIIQAAPLAPNKILSDYKALQGNDYNNPKTSWRNTDRPAWQAYKQAGGKLSPDQWARAGKPGSPTGEPVKIPKESTWQYGMGAEPYLRQAKEAGFISEELLKKSTEEGVVNWTKIDNLVKSYVTLLAAASGASGDLKKVLDFQVQELADQLNARTANSQIENKYMSDQTRIKSLMGKEGIPLFGLNQTLADWESDQIQDMLSGKNGNMSLEQLNKFQESVTGIAYSYAAYATANERVNSTLEAMGININRIDIDKWQKIQEFDPSFSSSITEANDTIIRMSEAIEKFEKVGFSDILKQFNLTGTLSDLESLKDKLEEMPETPGSSAAVKAINEYFGDKSALAVAISKAQVNAFYAGTYRGPQDVKLMKSQDYSKYLTQLGQLDRFTKLAESINEYDTTTLTLVDVTNNQSKTMENVNKTALQMIDALDSNTKSNEIWAEYNLPQWYPSLNKVRPGGTNGDFAYNDLSSTNSILSTSARTLETSEVHLAHMELELLAIKEQLEVLNGKTSGSNKTTETPFTSVANAGNTSVPTYGTKGG